MASVKKIKLTDGFAEFDPSSLVPLSFEQLAFLTPENPPFLFPSEADIQQQYTLRNIRKYTCAFLVGMLGLMGGMREVCANRDNDQKTVPVLATAPLQNSNQADVFDSKLPPTYPGFPTDISGLRNSRGKVQLHEDVNFFKKFRFNPGLKYSVEDLSRAANYGKTPKEKADGLSGLAKFGKYKNKVAATLLISFFQEENPEARLSAIETIQNISCSSDLRRLKKFAKEQNLLETVAYKLGVGPLKNKKLKRLRR